MVCPMLFAPCAFSMFPGMIDADVEEVINNRQRTIEQTFEPLK